MTSSYETIAADALEQSRELHAQFKAAPKSGGKYVGESEEQLAIDSLALALAAHLMDPHDYAAREQIAWVAPDCFAFTRVQSLEDVENRTGISMQQVYPGIPNPEGYGSVVSFALAYLAAVPGTDGSVRFEDPKLENRVKMSRATFWGP